MVIAALALAVVLAAHLGALLGARALARRAFPESQRDAVSVSCVRVLAGAIGWYFGNVILFAVVAFGLGEYVVDETSMRVHVGADGPAARAGVVDGDRIVKIAGQDVSSWDQMKRAIGAHPDESIEVEIERNGARLTQTVTPVGSPAKIMVGPRGSMQRKDVASGLSFAFTTPLRIHARTVTGVWRIVFGGEKPELVGPAGIVRETATSTREGYFTTLSVTASYAAYVLPWVFFVSALVELSSRRDSRLRASLRTKLAHPAVADDKPPRSSVE